MIESKQITAGIGKRVFITMFETGRSAAAIVAAEGLGAQVGNDAIEKAAREVIEKNPDNVAKFKSGTEGVFKFFVGQVMKATKGQADPQAVNDNRPPPAFLGFVAAAFRGGRIFGHPLLEHRVRRKTSCSKSATKLPNSPSLRGWQAAFPKRFQGPPRASLLFSKGEYPRLNGRSVRVSRRKKRSLTSSVFPFSEPAPTR